MKYIRKKQSSLIVCLIACFLWLKKYIDPISRMKIYIVPIFNLALLQTYVSHTDKGW